MAESRAYASPTKHVSKTSKPLLILHSDNDKSVPIANALTMIDVRQKARAKHAFHRYPEMEHMGINDKVIARTREFIKEVFAKPSEGK